jgi:RNA polymerase sigma-70 factor (ECF subfamily)
MPTALISELMALASDEDIVRRVLSGEVEAFELVMRRYNRRIYRIVRAILRSDDEAEDVMQEAYTKAYAHLRDFAGRARFSTWLTRIAVHEAFARSRQGRRFELVENADMETQTPRESARTPEQRASDRELGDILEQAIEDLPEGFRTVLVLRLVEQMSVEETSEALDLSEEAVKTRLHRARGVLKQRLSERVGAALPGLFDFGNARCDRVVTRVLERITSTKA